MREFLIAVIVSSTIGIVIVALLGTTRLNAALVQVDIFLRKMECFFILSRMERVPEGGEVVDYCGSLDSAMRWIRDRGWFQAVFPAFLTTTQMLVAAGIRGGRALEIGPGSGYLGLEWLQNATGGMNTAIEAPDLSSLFKVIEACHEKLVDMGAQRIHIDLNVDHRLDKYASILARLKAVGNA